MTSQMPLLSNMLCAQQALHFVLKKQLCDPLQAVLHP